MTRAKQEGINLKERLKDCNTLEDAFENLKGHRVISKTIKEEHRGYAYEPKVFTISGHSDFALVHVESGYSVNAWYYEAIRPHGTDIVYKFLEEKRRI